MVVGRRILSLLRGVGVFLVAGWSAMQVVWLATTSPEERAFVSRFEAIRSGMTGVQAVDLLGPPDRRGDRFELSQEAGYESEYVRARASGAVEWLAWSVGIDLTYTVGIDADGLVCMVSHGGT